jgi:cell division septation protein DedD
MGKKGKDTSKKKASASWMRSSRVLWIGLFVFACGWMFVLGIFVGRGTAPVRFDIEKLQNELASLKQALVKKEQLRFKIDPDSAPQKTDMGFYEQLRKPDSGAEQGSVRPGTAIKKKNKYSPKPAATRRQNKDASAKAVAAKPSRDRRKAGERVNTEPEKKLTIQVAALRDPKMADRMVAGLKDKWYPAYRAVAEVPGKGIWYRVRIGSFENRAAAQSTMERLKKDKIDAVLLPR